jgi:5-methylcytosine-specific restriction endonuclease McrA
MNCKKCNIQIPSRFVIDGKEGNLGKRKYCLSCSPFKANNRQKLERFTQVREGTKRNCLSCLKDFIYRRHQAMTINVCSACVSKQRRRQIKIKAVEYKGGKCQKCGYNKCAGALDFHHTVPHKKDFTISGNAGKWENIKKELDKCVLLCKNCHAEQHFLMAA